MKEILQFVGENPWFTGIIFLIGCLTISETAKHISRAIWGKFPKDDDDDDDE